MITHNADLTAERIATALDARDDPVRTLADFGAGLLRLLTDERSIALNRAAMISPSLARDLLESGRHRVGPIVERYFARLNDEDVLEIADPATAFEIFYGLLVRDTQIRVLLGEPSPSAADIRSRAETAVEQFHQLHGSPLQAGSFRVNDAPRTSNGRPTDRRRTSQRAGPGSQ